MIEAPQERPSEWRGGWTLALAACAGMTLSALPGVTMGLFIGPLEQQFKWSRATISSGLVVIAIMGAVLAPFIGMVIDRVGPRRIGIAGALLMCIAFSGLALTNGSLLLWYGLWFVIALAMVMLSPTVWTAAVASRFEASRGGAIAIALAGSAITGIFAPQMTGYMLSNHGWRTAYVGTAMIWGVVVLPLLFLFFFGASDIRRLMTSRADIATPQPAAGVNGWSALLSPVIAKLAIAGALAAGTHVAILVHMVPLLTSKGLSAQETLTIASMFGVGGVAGRIIAGQALDRIDARRFAPIAFGCPALAIFALLSLDLQFVTALMIVTVLALGSGAEMEITSYLTARYSVRQYGLIYGTISGVMMVGTGLGPLLLGLVFDRYGHYDLGLGVAGAIYLITALLIFSLPRHFATIA